MVNVLSNLNMAMCHAFIEDWNLMPPPIHLFKYDEDEQLVVNNQYTWVEEKTMWFERQQANEIDEVHI